ncbi:acyl-CoA dehydrogenase family protein [Corynebacterium frankenforstense]|uniref:acyl-CoA dehydrogenase family protein n=1 Tax=Corynebacterium frankenforstense TaxID=1230998 RepID=UPI0026F30CE3|nr:acyl-CoA dehydrogenase family protein [Corynebacterium frankenforstense]
MSNKTTTAKPESGSPAVLPTETDDKIGRGLRAILDGPWARLRREVRETINNPDLLPAPPLSLDEQRERLLGQVKAMGATGIQSGAFSVANGGQGENGNMLTSLEMIGGVNLQLMVKAGVQWGLWGGAVDALGTERHRQYVQDTIDLKLLGAFAMTERGHGSNVRDLETTAHFDPATGEFDIHSPTPSSEKTYLGNAAKHGSIAAVFAQLYTPESEESRGVHCFIVPIRDEAGNPLPGVTIEDNGHKGGLNGVDNGTLKFDHVRVPRENLLNRFGDVDEKGHYTSSIESDNRRFFTMLGTLIRGRIAVGAAAGAATRSALAIATKYATRRRQFETVPGKERLLIGHRQHRRRLIPRIARSYALALLQNQLIKTADERLRDTETVNRTGEDLWKQREFESRAAAVKIANTAHAMDAIQEAREACGGAGYMAENLLTTFRADADVFVTFEGDNTVLAQLVGKEIITAYSREMSGLSGIDIVKFGVDSVSEILRKRTPIPLTVQNWVESISRNDENSLFNASYQLKLFQEREQNMLRALGRRLRTAKDLPLAEAAEVVDKAQDHLIDCAWARVDTLLLEALLEAEADMDDLPEDSLLRKVFEQIRQLFALDTILKNSGWYQEKNVLAGGRISAARAAVNDLVDSLGPWAEQLVDGFGVPDVVLDVPMLTTRAGVEGVPEQNREEIAADLAASAGVAARVPNREVSGDDAAGRQAAE